MAPVTFAQQDVSQVKAKLNLRFWVGDGISELWEVAAKVCRRGRALFLGCSIGFLQSCGQIRYLRVKCSDLFIALNQTAGSSLELFGLLYYLVLFNLQKPLQFGNLAFQLSNALRAGFVDIWRV